MGSSRSSKAGGIVSQIVIILNKITNSKRFEFLVQRKTQREHAQAEGMAMPPGCLEGREATTMGEKKLLCCGE